MYAKSDDSKKDSANPWDSEASFIFSCFNPSIFSPVAFAPELGLNELMSLSFSPLANHLLHL